MATLESLGFELERRIIEFKTTTTMPDDTQLGFDGDPNTAVNGATPGQTLIYSCPLGTQFIQQSGTKWFKTALPNTWLAYATGGDTTNKADKVSGATEGNLAALDSTGNIVDSGVKVDDTGTGTGVVWTAARITAECIKFGIVFGE